MITVECIDFVAAKHIKALYKCGYLSHEEAIKALIAIIKER